MRSRVAPASPPGRGHFSYRRAIANDLDYLALSFVRSPDDLNKLRDHLIKAQSGVHLIAKIEKAEALKEIEQIIEVSDGLMLAQNQDYWPITKTIYELFQLIGTGKYVASALGVWAMAFLGITILGASLILGKKLGAIFRV